MFVVFWLEKHAQEEQLISCPIVATHVSNHAMTPSINEALQYAECARKMGHKFVSIQSELDYDVTLKGVADAPPGYSWPKRR